MKGLLRFVLSPFSLLYGCVTAVRNLFYDLGWLSSVSFDDVMLISVGNITIGGTGKTPLVEYLLRQLSCRNVAMLSRGYGRHTRGFVLVAEDATAAQVGDEPCQIKRKFPQLVVAVDENRVHGVRRLKELYPSLETIVLDDAFQHRHLRPSLSILVADYSRPLYRDGMLPGGRLREWPRAARRADMLIVSKTPADTTIEERKSVISRYRRLFPVGDILFSTITYAPPQSVFGHGLLPKEAFTRASVLLVTGIAAPQPLETHLRSIVAELHHLKFPDHHSFTDADVRHIEQTWKNITATLKYLITTEKDATRLQHLPLSVDIREALFAIPVEIRFLDDEAGSEEKLLARF